MKIFRSLRAKLVYVVCVSLAVAILPFYYTNSIFMTRIEKCKSQKKAVELLGRVAEFTNEAYSKEYNLRDFDKAKLQVASDALSGYYEKFAEGNSKVNALFSKNALSNFQQKKIRSNTVADMSMLITERASLFSDSRTEIRILMEATGASIPSIMADLIAYRAVLNSSEKNEPVSNNLFSRLAIQTRSMIFKLGKTSSESDFRIAPEIYEKTNRLNLQLWKIERMLSSQSQEIRASQIAEAVDMYELILFDIWGAVNRNLGDMLDAKLTLRENEFIFFLSAMFGALLLAIVLTSLISRNILRGLRNVSEMLKLASSSGPSVAKEFFENSFSKKTEVGELNENAYSAINYMSELIEVSKNIANTSNKINLMLRGMNATKTRLLVSIKDSFAEINKQIHSDYEFVLQEASILSESSALALEIERNLKSAKKICSNLDENIASISVSSNSISKNLSECGIVFEKISSTINAFSDAAEKINLLGLNLSIIAQKLGANSEGADTISSQIRAVSRQMAVSIVDIEALGASLSNLISGTQIHNSKIGEVAGLSKSSSKDIDSLADKSWREISDVGGNLTSVTTSLRSGVASSFDCNASVQNLDDIKDSIKDIASIVQKASENIEHFRVKIRALESNQ